MEHPVTEARFGVDLVAAMLRLAQGDDGVIDELRAAVPSGYAVQARVYAEDPQPGSRARPPGLVTGSQWPDSVRVDGWVETGTEVTSAYDPLLAKVIADGETREQAIDRLAAALAQTRIDGIETNLGLLAAALDAPAVREARHTTATLGELHDPRPRIEVRARRHDDDRPGLARPQRGCGTSGCRRRARWTIFRCAWPTWRSATPRARPDWSARWTASRCGSAHPATVCVAGAERPVTLDGAPVAAWEPLDGARRGPLEVGPGDGAGHAQLRVRARRASTSRRTWAARATFTLGALRRPRRSGAAPGRRAAAGPLSPRRR